MEIKMEEIIDKLKYERDVLHFALETHAYYLVPDICEICEITDPRIILELHEYLKTDFKSMVESQRKNTEVS